MQDRDLCHLVDIVNAARLVLEFVRDVAWDDFEEDVMRQSAVMKQLEVVGEAAKRIADKFRADHPAIPWRKMAGMRDVLVHAYDHVDLDEVWNAATVAVPELLQMLEPLIESLGGEEPA